MLLVLPTSKLDRLIAKSRHFIVLGFGIGIVAGQFGVIGIGTATMLVFLGAMLGSVDEYKTDRGLWMLALLFGGFSLIMYLTFEGFAVVDFVRGRNAAPWSAILDFAVATHLLWLQCRVLWSVFRYNRKLSGT